MIQFETYTPCWRLYVTRIIMNAVCVTFRNELISTVLVRNYGKKKHYQLIKALTKATLKYVFNHGKCGRFSLEYVTFIKRLVQNVYGIVIRSRIINISTGNIIYLFFLRVCVLVLKTKMLFLFYTQKLLMLACVSYTYLVYSIKHFYSITQFFFVVVRSSIICLVVASRSHVSIYRLRWTQ